MGEKKDPRNGDHVAKKPKLLKLSIFGPRFTWCNGWFGDQCTLLRLDRMVANEEWIKIFPEAKVHDVSMLASDHCLLVLLLKNNHYSKRGKKRFFFEEMWTREEECKEVIEMAWDPYKDDFARPIQERLERFQHQFQCWNQNSFENVYKCLKQKQMCLQLLESLNLLHKMAEEIQAVRKEINELHTKEEIMWNQRSRV